MSPTGFCSFICLVLAENRAIILAEFLDALGDVVSYWDLTTKASSSEFVPFGTVVTVLSMVAFTANIGSKLYLGVNLANTAAKIMLSSARWSSGCWKRRDTG